ncbi:unnamed protein product [Litomosoides sigmodontis]|uniref:Uncharacterized protein n=1 Tax=Litomosoides sigmodontis TaxID=42156 RepID=A0A3P6T4S7_LITSI|nr:unnamed protein product [Litomosoides sigmodontis]
MDASVEKSDGRESLFHEEISHPSRARSSQPQEFWRKLSNAVLEGNLLKKEAANTKESKNVGQKHFLDNSQKDDEIGRKSSTEETIKPLHTTRN